MMMDMRVSVPQSVTELEPTTFLLTRKLRMHAPRHVSMIPSPGPGQISHHLLTFINATHARLGTRTNEFRCGCYYHRGRFRHHIRRRQLQDHQSPRALANSLNDWFVRVAFFLFFVSHDARLVPNLKLEGRGQT